MKDKSNGNRLGYMGPYFFYSLDGHLPGLLSRLTKVTCWFISLMAVHDIVQPMLYFVSLWRAATVVLFNACCWQWIATVVHRNLYSNRVAKLWQSNDYLECTAFMDGQHKSRLRQKSGSFLWAYLEIPIFPSFQSDLRASMAFCRLKICLPTSLKLTS